MKVHKLSNGIKVVVVPMVGLNSVTLEVMLKIGAKFEEKNEAGLSHFVEHMAFKGTIKRPKAADIFREMDALGANYNAETGYESTAYSITTVRGNLIWSAEMMSDILFNSTFPENEAKSERGVIIEEIKMYKDNPMMGLSSDLVKFMYDKSPIGCWNISGEVKDMEKVGRKELVNFKNKHFNPKEMVIVLAGNVKETDLAVLIDYFGGFNDFKASELPKVKIVLNEQTEKIEKREVEQGHFAISVPTFGDKDERKYSLRLLDIILAGNASSRLFEEIRSKRGWAYYVFPVGETFLEDGFWGVQAGVRQDKLEEAVEVVENEILKIAETVKLEELDRAKSYLTGRIELLMDRSDFWTGYVGQKLLLEGELMNPQEELKKIEKVNLNEVIELARIIFVKNKIKRIVVSR